MISTLKGKLRDLVTREVLPKHGLVSYSQEGEDLVLRRFVDTSKPGFYVDVGAHHPVRFSNTKHYYDQGWRGINIDADPCLMEEFNLARPRDINLAYAVGPKAAECDFFIFNEPAINTFDPDLARQRKQMKGYNVERIEKLKVRTLTDILSKHLPPKQCIEFMTIDVEGFDLNVLKSNDWKHFRPRFVLVECLDVKHLADIAEDQVTRFLNIQKYQPVAKTKLTVIFANQEVL